MARVKVVVPLNDENIAIHTRGAYKKCFEICKIICAAPVEKGSVFEVYADSEAARMHCVI